MQRRRHATRPELADLLQNKLPAGKKLGAKAVVDVFLDGLAELGADPAALVTIVVDEPMPGIGGT